MSGPRRRPAVLVCCSFILAGVLLDRPANRARALRALSSVCGRTAAALRRISVSSGLAYIDIAYPSVDIGVSVETTPEQRNIG